MARTAPAPNIPPTPGMNPGAWVAGGGGAGGGKGGKGGGAGGAGEGADGEDGGEDANGEGNGAGACGNGGPGDCTNCGSNIAAGDPIDVIRGNVFTSGQTDLSLPGHFNFIFARMYSSLGRQRDIGFGFGWNFSLGWVLARERRRVRVYKPDGKVVGFDVPEPGEVVISAGGWRLWASPDHYILDAADGFRHYFTRREETGDCPLVQVADNNLRRLELAYDRDRLTEVVDTVGRRVRLQRDHDGRIRRLELLSRGNLTRFAEYDYDDSGDLVMVRHRGGHWMRFSYRDHLLTRMTHPDGLTFHFKYDRHARCVETWGDYGDEVAIAGLASDVPDVLTDGATAARGLMHVRVHYGEDGYREVYDSMRTIRVTGNEHAAADTGITGAAVTTRTYSDEGHVTSRTNALGETTHYENDRAGRLIRETDAMGHTVEIHRDGDGRIHEVVDPEGGRGASEYDARGNRTAVRDQNGNTVQFAWDEAGELCEMVEPTGARTTFEYDDEASLCRLTLPNGGVWQYEYNEFGRCVAATDPSGATTRYVYDDALRVTEIHLPNGGTETYEYDAMNRLVRFTDADGNTRRHSWTGLDLLRRSEFANGEVLEWEYNREGWPAAAVNQAGRRHQLTWNENRQLTKEITFDQRPLSFSHDLLSRMVTAEDAAGEIREYERDAAGRVTRQAYADGEELSFQYNRRSELMLAKTPGCEVEFERNAVGAVTRESMTIAGQQFVIERELDPARRLLHQRTSLGHEVSIERDAFGRAVVTTLDDTTMRHEHDVLGREVSRELPVGRLETRYSPMGWVAQRKLVLPGDQAPHEQPEWVGGDESFRGLSFEFTAAGLLRSMWSCGDSTEYEYDGRGRLLSVQRANQQVESYAYDSEGNIYDSRSASGSRKYAELRLQRNDGIRYEYDDNGQLVSRIRSSGEGEEAGDVVEQLEWSSRGLLKSVAGEDFRADYEYDAFARRVRKRISRLNKRTGEFELDSDVVFVWFGAELIHEVELDSDGNRVVVRTYAYEDRSGAPIAQREASSPWKILLNDFNDTPRGVVEADGSISPIRLSSWGMPEDDESASATPHRFLGQYYDAETGFHYNRARYYDPESARYISPDPIGLRGETHPYAYCFNPLTWVDPLGLRARRPPHEVDGVSLTTPGPPQTTTTPSDTGRPNDSFYSGYTEDDRYPGREDEHCQGLTRGRAYWESHTERKAMRWAEEATGYDPESNPDALQNAQLNMNAPPPNGKAPCNTCNRAMERWTAETGATITYAWPTGNRRTYSGGVGSGDIRAPYERAPT